MVPVLWSIRELYCAMIERELARRGYEGVSAVHEKVIRVLSLKSPARLSVIVEEAGKAKSTITATVQTLEKYGYVTKERDGKDSRSRLVSLTERGRALSYEFLQLAAEAGERMGEGLGEDEKGSLVKALVKVEENLRAADI